MGLPHVLEQVRKRPSMYFHPVEFDVASAFLEGFNLASYVGALVGFREWLVMRLGYANNLAWPALVLRLVFPDVESPRQFLVQNGKQKRAVESLFGLLEEFWQEWQSDGGLRRIYVKYQEWLRQQDWYGPSSPDWIPVKGSSPDTLT